MWSIFSPPQWPTCLFTWRLIGGQDPGLLAARFLSKGKIGPRCRSHDRVPWHLNVDHKRRMARSRKALVERRKWGEIVTSKSFVREVPRNDPNFKFIISNIVQFHYFLVRRCRPPQNVFSYLEYYSSFHVQRFFFETTLFVPRCTQLLKPKER